MSAVIEQTPQLPPAVARRGISEGQWRTLMNNLYPGASGESVLMVWDYCAARRLDPMKKPCHIVPMRVKQGDNYVWRDVVLPGIYEYRTTAHRTGQYLGHSTPVYGEIVDCGGTMAPSFCEMTIYRWNPLANLRAEYPVKVLFTEYVALKDGKPNQRWAKAPLQMLTKCAEAAGLREAFPEELGGVPTMEEMEGHVMDEPVRQIDLGPRPDTSQVDSDLVMRWISDITDTLNQDKEEADIAADLREINTNLSQFPDLFTMVLDKLAADKIISKANYRKYLAIGTERAHA
jgi:phage recombination protein Bet